MSSAVLTCPHCLNRWSHEVGERYYGRKDKVYVPKPTSRGMATCPSCFLYPKEKGVQPMMNVPRQMAKMV